MKKYILLILAFLLLSSVAEADDFKVFIGLTQPITPAMSLEKGNKILMSIDILSKLDLDFRASGLNMIFLEKSKKNINIYNQYDMPFIDIAELCGALGVDYIRRNNNVTIYNKIISATCENGFVNLEFAFASTYEYSYWNNCLVVDLIGSVHNPNALALNRDPKNVADILFGQVTLDSARSMFKLNTPVPNTKPIRQSGSSLYLKLNIGNKVKNFIVDNMNIYANFRDNIIHIKGGANLKYTINEDMDTGKITISFSNGSFNGNLQKVHKTGLMSFTVTKNTITTMSNEIKGIKTEYKLSDLIITLSPPKGVGVNIKNLRVTIDPGHGDKDVGAKYKTLYEKDINYRAAIALKKELEARGVLVYMTRGENGFLSLAQRGQVAIDTDSDIFISLHTNSTAKENKASGLETYYRGAMFSAEYLGRCLHGEMVKGLPIPNKGLKKDTVLYSSGLGVLRKCNSGGIPCVLIELGFINHSTDRAYLQSDEYLANIAKAIADGVEEYITGKPLNQLK
ncbi:MAG: N-acetylmuramoyl-L-alanine amidase [Abditibacteriota bacterium]|nr:N-acetylmuramoyl-L-alanine amidase [Abditibacteriota bacterium]